MTAWLEITPDYRCNNRCVGCYAVQEDGPSMAPLEIGAALQRGRREGATSLWLGGGEPTLRRDLFPIVREARRMGYTRIKLQTNGMMLAYRDFADRCKAAGVTEVAFSLKGSQEVLHDRLAQTPGCHARMVEGIANAKTFGLFLEGDVLLCNSNAADLPALVTTYFAQGLSRFRIWLLSAHDHDSDDVRAEVPTIATAAAWIRQAIDLHLSDAPDFIVSLHTPPCTMLPEHGNVVFNAAALDMLIVNPGGHAFRLEDSPMEGGTYLARCEACEYRQQCGGIRSSYLRQFGDAEFQPVLNRM